MDKVEGVLKMKHCPATNEQIQDLQDDLIATMPTYTHFKIDQLCAQARSFNEPCTDAKEQGHGCLRAVKAENELAAQKEQYRVLEDEMLVMMDERNAAVAALHVNAGENSRPQD